MQVGDRVYLAGAKTGTYAEFCIALETTVYPLPANASYEAGAALGVAYATAHRVTKSLPRQGACMPAARSGQTQAC